MNSYTVRGLIALAVALWALSALTGCTVATATPHITRGTVSTVTVVRPEPRLMHPVVAHRYNRSVTVVCQ